MKKQSFQKVPVVFGQGLSDLTHPTQIPVGKLSKLENCVLKKSGSLSKRHGFNNLNNNILGTVNELDTAIAAQTYNKYTDSELILFDNKNAYSYKESLNGLKDVGTCTAVDAEVTPLITNSHQQTNPDVANANGINLVAWDNSTGTVQYSLFDASNNSVIRGITEIESNLSLPQCVSFNDQLLLLASDTSNRLRGFTISAQSVAATTAYNLTVSLENDNIFNSCVRDGYLYVAYNDQDGTAKIKQFNNQFVEQNTLSFANNADKAIDIVALDSLIDGYGLYCSYVDSSNILHLNAVSGDLSSFREDNTVSSCIASHVTTNGTTTYFDDQSTSNYPVIYKVVNSTGDRTVLSRGVTLSSRVFDYDTREYILTEYEPITSGTIQPTSFLLNNLGEVVAKVNNRTSGGNRTTLSNVVLYNNNYLIAETKLGKIVSDVAKYSIFKEYALSGVVLTRFDFDVNYASVNLQRSLFLTGGVLQQYDGNTVTEAGFHLYPDDRLISANTAGGSIPAGTYSYIITYEWTDNTGKVDRSAGSAQKTVELGTDSDVTLTIPTLKLTKKDNVRIVVYRTQVNRSANSLHYRVTSALNPLLNDSTVDTVDFVDDNLDSAISSNEVYYASRNSTLIPIELENLSAPNCNIIALYGNRLFVAGTDEKSTLFFSKTTITGELPAFSDIFRLDVNPKGGSITGVVTLDDKLIIFKSSAIFVLSGPGPDNTGSGEFPDAQEITSDIGCIDAKSIGFISSLGVVFKSSKGIWLLDRGLNTTYIGADVDSYNNYTIVSVDSVPGTNEVRFTTSDGPTLVYNYFFQQWSTFTNHQSVDAGIYNDNYYHLTSDGIVHLEDTTSYSDNGQAIDILIKTGFLNFGFIQNELKLGDIYLLGDYIGPHKLTIKLYIDNSIAPLTPVEIDTTNIFSNETYGSVGPYGTGIYGGSFNNEQFKIQVRPRCQNVSVEIISQDEGDSSAALNFTALLFEVKPKGAAGRIKASHKV